MRSVIVRVNPLALLVVGVAAVFGSLGIDSMQSGLLAVGLYAAAVLLFTPSWRYALVCLAVAVFAGLTVGYSTWRLGGHDESVALAAGLRIVALAWPGAVVAGYIDPARLGDYLGQNLRLPARPVVAVTSSMQQVGVLVDTMSQLRSARRARGLSATADPLMRLRTAGQLVFALLVSALRQATGRAVAMDARGFATAQRRTWAEPAHWSRLDAAAIAIGLLLAAAGVFSR